MARKTRGLWVLSGGRARRPYSGQNRRATFVIRASLLAIEAQQVIAMRLAKIAASQRGSRAEMLRMAAEKPAALVRAQMDASLALLTGSKPHVAASKWLGVYRGAVRANHRRLRKG